MIWCDHCLHKRPGNNYMGQNLPFCDSPYSLPKLIVARLLSEVLRYWEFALCLYLRWKVIGRVPLVIMLWLYGVGQLLYQDHVCIIEILWFICRPKSELWINWILDWFRWGVVGFPIGIFYCQVSNRHTCLNVYVSTMIMQIIASGPYNIQRGNPHDNIPWLTCFICWHRGEGGSKKDLIDTARAIAQQSAVVTKLANRLAAECTDKRMRTVSWFIVTQLLG